MADGSHKPIEDVKIGDKVIATDPTTGKTTTQVVTDTITGNGDKHLVQITIHTDGKHGGNSGLITATDGHPFWVGGHLNEWLKAKDLKPGMWLRTSAGTYVQISAIKTWTQHRQVYNLTVDTTHTYYVEAGATSVLVHNCGGPYEGVREASEMLREAGVPRQFRKQIIDSFEAGTIKVETAGNSTFGMRFYDGINADARGRYLTQDFGANREQLALRSRWNQMTRIAQFQIRPGTRMITGRVAGQGAGYPGGATQMYILNLDDLL